MNLSLMIIRIGVSIEMLNIIKSVYKKNRVSMLRAYPISFILQRVLSSIFALLTPVLLYYFVFNQMQLGLFHNIFIAIIVYISFWYLSREKEKQETERKN